MRSTLSQPLAKFAIYLEAYILLFGPFIQDFRLLHFTEWVTQVQFYGTFPLQTLSFILLVTFRRDVNQWKLDRFEIFLILLAIWALIITVLNLGGPQDIGANFMRIILVYFSYRAGRDIMAKEPEESVWKLLNFWGRVGIWGVVAGDLFLYGGVFAHHQAYLGLGTEMAFIGYAIILVNRDLKRRGLLLWGVAALIIIGGKRGNMLSLIAIIMAYEFLVLKQGRISAKILRNAALGFAALIFIVGGIFATGSAETMSNFIPKPLAARFAAFSAQNEEGGVDVTAATAGRNFEVDDVLEQWRERPSGMWTGFGLGAHIILPSGEKVNTVHISPLALAHIFGIPFGITLYLAAWWMGTQIFFLSGLRTARKTDLVWALVAVGLLTSSLSVFIIMQNPLIWIAVGALAGRKRQPSLATLPAPAPA